MKDSFLPPITSIEVATSDADDEDSHSGDEDTYLYKREEDFWSKRIPKYMNLNPNPNGNRTVANQSSLSDSFVLPTIPDSLSPGKGDYPTYKKSRTAGGRLDHFSEGPKRTNGIPLSKSCPTLSRRKGHHRRRANAADASDEFSEEMDSDRKAISYNIGSELRKELNNSASHGRGRSKKKSRGKKTNHTQNHHQIYENEHHNSTNDLILPSIFATGGVNDNADWVHEEQPNPSKSKQSIGGNASKQYRRNKSVSITLHSPSGKQETDAGLQLPVMFEVDGQSDKSIEMDFPPWDGRSAPRGEEDEIDMA